MWRYRVNFWGKLVLQIRGQEWSQLRSDFVFVWRDARPEDITKGKVKVIKND